MEKTPLVGNSLSFLQTVCWSTKTRCCSKRTYIRESDQPTIGARIASITFSLNKYQDTGLSSAGAQSLLFDLQVALELVIQAVL